MKIKLILLCLLFCVSCGFIITPKEDKTNCTAMPPGYSLEVDQYGNYRPLDTDGDPLLWIRLDREVGGYGTKCEAIERAWEQYNYESKTIDHNWRKTK